MASGHQVKEICVYSEDRKRAVTWWLYLCSVAGNVDIVLAPDCRKSWNLPPTMSHFIFTHMPTNDSQPEVPSSDIYCKKQCNHPTTDRNEGEGGRQFN